MERTEGTTIWLVSDGSYSDYHVLGIYSTHELAVAAKEAHNAYNEIEEWELDQIPPGPPGLFYWHVAMDRAGNSTSAKRVSNVRATPFSCAWAPYRDNDRVSFFAWAADEQHAVKIANERRTALIASGQWTTDWRAWNQKR